MWYKYHVIIILLSESVDIGGKINILPSEKARRFDGIFPRNMFKWSGRNIEAGDGRA